MDYRQTSWKIFYETCSRFVNFLKNNNINSIFLILSKEYKNPKSELNSPNSFTFLVSVVLSAQSTDIAVNKATKDLYKVVKSPYDMVNLGKTKLKKYIKTIGLYNNKANNIISLSKTIIKKYRGKIPKEFDLLIKLPGVGKKTASVYQNVVLKKPKIAVDTHVFRVSNRLGIVKEKNTDKTQDRLEEIIPSKWKMKAHHFLILHGRKICKSQKPKCEICKISSFCDYLSKSF